MRTLVFMRHARSVQKQPGQADFARSLSTRGRLEAPRMAQALAQRGFCPELIISSPAERALMTARLIAEELTLADHVVSREPVLYEASAEHYLEVIQRLSDNVKDILLVGHNPGITEFVNTLLPGTVGELPPGGLVGIGMDSVRWSEVKSTCGKLLFVEHPMSDRS